MKLLRRIITLSFCTMAVAFASAQKMKLGHINTGELLEVLPEKAEAEKQMQKFAKELEGQLATMSAEWEAKVAEYQAGETSMTPIIKQTKAKEITDLEQRIKQFQASAQESLQGKENELLAPMIDKAKKAIEEVSKENGYNYVFDSSAGFILHSPDTDDLMPLVKKKLGI